MHNTPPSVVDQLAFLDLVEFPAFVILSIYYARNVQLHARYIVCTALLFMPPALTLALFIFPQMRSFQVAVNTAEALVIVILLMLIVSDWRQGKIWAPYPLALLVFTTLAIICNDARAWAWWHRLSEWMAGSPA